MESPGTGPCSSPHPPQWTGPQRPAGDLWGHGPGSSQLMGTRPAGHSLVPGRHSPRRPAVPVQGERDPSGVTQGEAPPRSLGAGGRERGLWVPRGSLEGAPGGPGSCPKSPVPSSVQHRGLPDKEERGVTTELGTGSPGRCTPGSTHTLPRPTPASILLLSGQQVAPERRSRQVPSCPPPTPCTPRGQGHILGTGCRGWAGEDPRGGRARRARPREGA